MTRSRVALLLCSLGSLIACDGEPTTVAQAEVSGTISYRERIELPRGATVRIVAEDGSRDDPGRGHLRHQRPAGTDSIRTELRPGIHHRC